MSDLVPTDFERAVVEIIRTEGAHGAVSAYRLRTALMERGFGKHPAAVAMNLTRIAWRERFFTSYVHHDERQFMLTSEGSSL